MSGEQVGTATHQIAILGALGRGIRTIDELEAHLPISRRSIHRAVSRLIIRGLIAREEAGYGLTRQGIDVLESGVVLKSGRYRSLTARRAPNRDTFRQRAWSAMRLQPRFVQADILLIAARDSDGNAFQNLQSWVGLLQKAGYLAILPTRTEKFGREAGGACVYRLVRNTGEIAPMYRATLGVLSDMNIGEDFRCK
ncbi:MAG TPA: helix-turn-helix domain-containing protein [Ancylobacter sp.]